MRQYSESVMRFPFKRIALQKMWSEDAFSMDASRARRRATDCYLTDESHGADRYDR